MWLNRSALGWGTLYLAGRVLGAICWRWYAKVSGGVVEWSWCMRTRISCASSIPREDRVLFSRRHLEEMECKTPVCHHNRDHPSNLLCWNRVALCKLYGPLWRRLLLSPLRNPSELQPSAFPQAQLPYTPVVSLFTVLDDNIPQASAGPQGTNWKIKWTATDEGSAAIIFLISKDIRIC